jgi:hypothetical protein
VPEAVKVGAVAEGQSTEAGQVCAAEPPSTSLRVKPHSSSLAVGLEKVQVTAPVTVAVTEFPSVRSILVAPVTLPRALVISP